MFQRLLRILASLKTEKRIEETEISTTVDDMKEGKRKTFDKERVRELLEKCDLLERPEE